MALLPEVAGKDWPVKPALAPFRTRHVEMNFVECFLKRMCHDQSCKASAFCAKLSRSHHRSVCVLGCFDET